jgi:FkbM family methyltransferase
VNREWACPENDPGFADDSRHGANAQRRYIQTALSFVRGRDTAIDIGAHIGLCTVELMRHFGHVEAFEPVGENFRCLLANTAFDPTDVRCHSVALGSGYGTRMATQHGDNSGCWNLRPGYDIEIVPLDCFMSELVNVDFIKIDVEGMEGAVVLGAAKLIDRDRPAVLFEDNGLGPELYGREWVDPKAVLTQMGYRKKYRERKDELWLP